MSSDIIFPVVGSLSTITYNGKVVAYESRPHDNNARLLDMFTGLSQLSVLPGKQAL
jgi:hypothetical protein